MLGKSDISLTSKLMWQRQWWI